ncbi:MAG: DUF4159 domain-containing protein [Elusimicrobiota bacterium]
MSRNFTLAIALLLFGCISVDAQRPDLLRVGILTLSGQQVDDPYPMVWRDLARALQDATSIETDAIFKYPVSPTEAGLREQGLIFLQGTASFVGFSSLQREALLRWMRQGAGTLVINNVEGAGFDARIRKEIAAMFAKERLEPIPMDHAVFKSFYLVRSVGGALLRSRSLEGIKIGERYALIYSNNDLLGALVKTTPDTYLYNCYPGGEDQRKETFKLVVDLFMYTLTGTYKSDVIHMPFIERKLKR